MNSTNLFKKIINTVYLQSIKCINCKYCNLEYLQNNYAVYFSTLKLVLETYYFLRLYSNLIGYIGCDKSNTPTRDNFNSIEEQRIGQISTEQGRNATNDDQETLHIDEDTSVILCSDDIQEATATDSISADKIVIIQPEELQPDIVNLLECQEENTIFVDTTVQLMEFQSGIDNLENQENNENIQNTGKYLIVCITYIELQWLICKAISIKALIFFTGTSQDIPNVPSPFKKLFFGLEIQLKIKRKD